MTTLVLLPGMDGTGALFGALLEQLAREIATRVIAYPTQEPLSYEQLADFVLERLPSPPFVLLGESFSGPVALAVAAQSTPSAVILVCSFAANPRPMLTPVKPLLRWLPKPAHFIGLLSLVLMGRYGTPSLRTALSRSLQAVSPAVLRRRAASVLSVDARRCLAQLRCPILYLQASHDRVVPARCAQEVLRIQPATTLVGLKGPHFLLQTQPAAAAQVIGRFLRGIAPAACI
jgi:pimeloyl-ACP methyl ester carboxylesterase